VDHHTTIPRPSFKFNTISNLFCLIYFGRLDIGFFGLLAMLAVSTGPFMGRFIDRLVPWYASIVATILLAIFQSVHTAAGGINVAAVIIACFGLDVFLQPQQVSLTASVFT
jgi:hypothetical protein